MRDAFQLGLNRFGEELTGIHCQCCGRKIVFSVPNAWELTERGSTRRFCACRQAAYRRRRAGVPENTPAQRQGGRGRGLKPSSKPGGAKSDRAESSHRRNTDRWW